MVPGTVTLEFRSLKKTARFGAKVRSGCLTCKKRRVKCDEQRPDCARCIHARRQCMGYADAQTNPGARFQRSPTSVLSDLGDNLIYLEFYHHCAGLSVAGNFDRDFWTRIVPQLTSEPTVRHAVAALGYLLKTESGSLKHARSSSTAESRKPLLVSYNQAVRCLIERMSQPSYSIEIGLVACLLFICIECLRGDYPAAFTHLHSGLKVMMQTELQSPSSSLAGCAMDPGMIASNLAPIFTRAITNGLLFGAPFEPLLDSHCPSPLASNGHSFGSIQKAQTVLCELRNATIILISVLYRKFTQGLPVNTDDMYHHSHLLNCHKQWFSSLQSLEIEHTLSKQDSIVSSSLKVSHYCTSIALACALDIDQAGFDAQVDGFKALNYHARTVLDSTQLVDSFPTADEEHASPFQTSTSKHPVAHFTFDISIIAPLYFAATRCRCPVTRRESLALLERNPPREALWDAEQHAMVVRRTIKLEESEVDALGWPVQRTRLGPAIIREIDGSGGFWVGFRSITWMLGGRHPERPPSCAAGKESEWEEWFQL